MSDLHDKRVEAAAKALYEYETGLGVDSWDRAYGVERSLWRDQARAALEAADAVVAELDAADRLAALTTAQEAEGFGGAATVAVSPKGEKGHQEGNVRERLIEALAARHWDRDSGEVEHWVELTDSEKENVIENYIVRDSADAILAAFPELGRDIAGEIEAERADMGEGIGDVYYAQGLARAADIARAGR